MQNQTIKKKSSQTFVNGALILSASMIIVKLCGMAVKIVLANIYSMFGENFAEYGSGLWTNAYNIYVPFFTLATAGFPIAVSRLISESIAEKRYNDVKQIYKSARPFFIIMGLVCCFVMICGSFIYVNIIKSQYAIYPMLTLAPSIFFGCLVSIYRGYFEGQRNMAPTAISEIVEAATKLLLGLSFAYIVMKLGMNEYTEKATIFGQTFPTQQDAMSTLIAYSVASAIFAISLGSFFAYISLKIIYKRKNNQIPEEYYINSVVARSQHETFMLLLKTALPIGLAALVMSISSTIDDAVIQNVLYNMAVNKREQLLAQFDGNYDSLIPKNYSEDNPITIHTSLAGANSYATTIMQLVTAVTQVFGTSAMPSVTNAYTKGDKAELKKSIETVLKLTVLFTFPAGIGLFVLPYPIISLFYHNYGAVVGARVLRVMGISVIFIAVSTPICSMLQGVGRIDMPLKLYSIAMAMKIILNYAFVSVVSINIVGGAVGSLVAYLFVCVAGMYFLIKKARVMPDFFNTVLKPFAGAIICGAAAYISYNFISSYVSSNIAVITAIVIAAMIYLISLLLMHTFTESEIKMLPKSKNIVTILAKLHLLG